MKKKAAKLIGIKNIDIALPEDVSLQELLKQIDSLNENEQVHGILVQLPLPSHLKEDVVLSRIRLEKDVDGFHSQNMGLLAMKGREPLAQPCTPSGCIELLKRYNIPIAGKKAVVLGRSNIVGIPIALMLIKENATVTICHSRTVDLKKEVLEADILIAAIGKPKFVQKDWIKKGAVIIDVGINEIKNEEGQTELVGDTDFDAICSDGNVKAITPVPGGVGPMTIAMLMQNTLRAFERNNKRIGGDTPLHDASSLSNNEKTIEILLKHKANVNE
eukprot:CAMPEP_0117423050 /NCGR_PEP_ID=MMETSP0758-20121206/3768_1 /TAXON_ID=63605 /ORGANISM="Percolomonas cosmopolitus, Strain AE-1 (ATCC 50343)" /LENGTH=273 /DNA_ID=CAMNT_0005206039 /DNA_START=173 /DNA_END=991 /DNA_ORIENTATION=-